jgi:hypothetical protein
MRKYLFIFCALIPALLNGAQVGSFHVNNDISGATASVQQIDRTNIEIVISNLDYMEESIDGLNRYTISLPNEFGVSRGSFLGPDSSVLPTTTRLIAVPFDSDPKFHVVNSSYVDLDNIALAGAGAEELDALNSASPALVEGREAGIMRDLRLYSLVISPVQYDPQRRKLRVYDHIEIEVEHSGSKITAYDNQISEAFAPIYRSLVDNPQVFDPIKPTRGAYWIIYPDAFQSFIQPLVSWKKAKGFSVETISKTQIGANSYTNIHDYILARFDSCLIKPDYIVIIGDVLMAYNYGIATKEYTNPYGFGDIESDNYYTFLHGNDYFPELFIGRISVANNGDLAAYFGKLFSYEKTPYMADTSWYLRGMVVGGADLGNFVSPRLTKLWCREAMLQSGFTQVDTFFDNWSGHVQPSDINAAIDSGVSWVNYRGYGTAGEWEPPVYDLSNFDALTNGPMYPIMTSIVCGTGDYNDDSYPECFGEHWIRIPLRGGAGFIGNSNHDAHTRWTNAIDVGIYWGLFTEHVMTLTQAQLMGKMTLYYAFPENAEPGGEIELYFNSYNDLADPEINCWTAVPKRMVATYPDSVSFGENRIDVHVADLSGAAIDGAVICIWKGNEVFQTGITEADGNYEFLANPQSPGNMKLTVTARGYIPCLDSVIYYNSPVVVGYLSHIVDDDSIGESFGNGDGFANPSETIELPVMLKNYGTLQTAHGITATLTSESSAIAITRGNASYPDIAIGDSAGSNLPFLIHIAPDALNKIEARLPLNISDIDGHAWQGLIQLPISSSEFVIDNVAISGGDGDNYIDPGETLDLVLTARNVGQTALNGATAILRTSDRMININDSIATFGDCAPGESFINSGDHFTVYLRPDAYNGHLINFTVQLTGTGPQVVTASFSKTVGLVTSRDPIGPDAYGYYCFDNTDTAYAFHPVYNWINIQTSWPSVTFGDDEVATIPLPFDMQFYGQHYDSVTICDNGWIAMGGTWYNVFYPAPIPSPQDAEGMIAAYWCDISPGPTIVYYQYDTVNNWFVIGWRDAYDSDNFESKTFEILLLDQAIYPTITGDNEIILQYNQASINNIGSVGICSPDRRDGVGYLFNDNYPEAAAPIANGRAIKFTTGARPPCAYLPGDINNNGAANGIDIVYGVNYFKGGNAPPYDCDCPPHGRIFVGGDVNGSCDFNGIDITYFVRFLRGQVPALQYCFDCPPPALLAAPVAPRGEMSNQAIPVLKARNLRNSESGDK